MYIKICKIVFFWLFFIKLRPKFCRFLNSFRGISVLSCKNSFRSLRRFTIALCRSFVITSQVSPHKFRLIFFFNFNIKITCYNYVFIICIACPKQYLCCKVEKLFHLYGSYICIEGAFSIFQILLYKKQLRCFAHCNFLDIFRRNILS